MLLAYTIFSLIAVCLIAAALRMRGVRLAYIWLVLFISLVAVCLILLIAVPINVKSFVRPDYFSSGTASVDLIFQLTAENRLAGIGLFTFVLAFLTTDAISPRGNQTLFRWFELLISASAVWLVLLAANAWTVLLAWTVLDLVSLLSDLIYRHRNAADFAPFYLSKFIGSILLVYIIARAYQASPQNLLGSPIPNLGLWLAASVLFHSGLLFSKFPPQPKEDMKYQIVQKFIFLLPNLFLLTVLPQAVVSSVIGLVSQIIFLAAAIVFALRWFYGKNEFEHLDDLARAFAIMAAYLAVTENQQGLVYFLLTIFPIIWIFIYDHRYRGFTAIWVANLALISGLPISLNFIPNYRMITNGNFLAAAIFSLPMAIFMAGIIRFVVRMRGKFSHFDRISRAVYGVGLLIPIIVLAFISLTNSPVININYIWIGAMQVFSTGLLLFVNSKTNQKKIEEQKTINLLSGIKGVRIDLKRTTNMVTDLIGEGLHFAASLFEGQGGILWSIVFLSLLLTIIAFQGGLS